MKVFSNECLALGRKSCPLMKQFLLMKLVSRSQALLEYIVATHKSWLPRAPPWIQWYVALQHATDLHCCISVRFLRLAYWASRAVSVLLVGPAQRCTFVKPTLPPYASPLLGFPAWCILLLASCDEAVAGALHPLRLGSLASGGGCGLNDLCLRLLLLLHIVLGLFKRCIEEIIGEFLKACNTLADVFLSHLFKT